MTPEPKLQTAHGCHFFFTADWAKIRVSMDRKIKTIFLAMAVTASMALLLLAGCGDDETPTTAFVCDQSAPSLIPPPAGKPQHIYFYRDT